MDWIFRCGGIHPLKLSHFLGGEFKVKNINVFLDMPRVNGLGNNDHILLYQIPQSNLRGCFAVNLGDLHYI